MNSKPVNVKVIKSEFSCCKLLISIMDELRWCYRVIENSFGNLEIVNWEGSNHTKVLWEKTTPLLINHLWRKPRQSFKNVSKLMVNESKYQIIGWFEFKCTKESRSRHRSDDVCDVWDKCQGCNYQSYVNTCNPPQTGGICPLWRWRRVSGKVTMFLLRASTSGRRHSWRNKCLQLAAELSSDWWEFNICWFVTPKHMMWWPQQFISSWPG